MSDYPMLISNKLHSFRNFQKQINSIIKYKLANEDTPIGIIADELHFSSQPQFCRYCKRNFGYTPGEWRGLLKNRNKTPKRLSDRV
jgi:hypothetical protein